MTDEKTAAALAAHSERAVADVIARYSRHLYTVAAAALRGVGTEQDAEEAAADAFVYLWEHPEKFDPRRGSLKTWLSVVARSRALDRSREILRCRAVSLEEIELADPLGVPETLLAGERRAALQRGGGRARRAGPRDTAPALLFRAEAARDRRSARPGQKAGGQPAVSDKAAAARERDRRGRRVICAHSARKTTVTFKAYLPKKPACRSENAAPRALRRLHLPRRCSRRSSP